MIWTLLALIAATLPYFAKVVFWLVVNKIQGIGGEIGVFNLDQLISAKSFACPSVDKYECFKVGQLIFGADKGGIYVLIPATLVLYNLLRGFLTYKLAPMRDEEERSGYTPVWQGQNFWSGYQFLYLIHKAVSFLWYLAVAVFIWNLCKWLLFTHVYVGENGLFS